MHNFSKNLKTLRKFKSLTQAELAEKLGVYHTRVSEMETGNMEPTIEILIKLSSIFDVTIDALLLSAVVIKHKEWISCDYWQTDPNVEAGRSIMELADK